MNVLIFIVSLRETWVEKEVCQTSILVEIILGNADYIISLKF